MNNYAIISEENIVENIIWIDEENLSIFPNVVFVGDRAVQPGDTYDGENFYRDGEKCLTPDEEQTFERLEIRAALTLLGIEEEN